LPAFHSFGTYYVMLGRPDALWNNLLDAPD
jgi:hypothetical protein